jgi:hypothetical protein
VNAHTPTDDETDDVKDSFYEELERVFHKFPKYNMRIQLADFSAKVGEEGIFKLTIENESVHEISNGNGVRLVNFATPKNLRVKSTMFPHPNIRKYTRVVRKIRFPRSCSREERCYAGSGDTGV